MGNLTLAYNGAQNKSDLITFNPVTGLASLVYNSSPSSADVATFSRAIGATSFTYNGAASASDLFRFTQVQGTTAITYNGAASADDVVSFSQSSGTVTLSYNGANAPAPFAFAPGTTPDQFQSYLASVPGLTGAGAVAVSGNPGGPFNVHFAGVAGGASLAVASGPATISQAFFYSVNTTPAQLQSYLASIPALAGVNAVAVNGLLGGPFNINFGTGLVGGSQLVASGAVSLSQAFLDTPNTTSANFQAYLASIPGLTAASAVSVNGAVGGPFNIGFGTGVTGGNKLVAVAGGNATLAAGAFANSTSATAANVQAYLASIPALAAVGAVTVNATAAGGPYTVSYGSGIAGDPLLTVVGSMGATIAAAPGFAFSAGTTTAQFAAYLATLPGLAAAGAVTVTGTTGGPFNVAYGAGVTGGSLLTVVNSGPGIVTQQYSAASPGGSILNPINDEVGLTVNGILFNNDGFLSSPWYLTGNTITIKNTDSTLTNGITNTTASYPSNPGLFPPNSPPITTVIALGQNASVNGPIVLSSAATITDDGPAPTSVTAAQISLLISSAINLNGNTLTSGPSATTMSSGVTDVGLTDLAGTISFTGMTNTNSLVEAGYGILEVSASNTFDGKTSVTSGVLIDAATNGLGSNTSSTKTVNNTNLFPIPGFPSSGAALGFAFGGDNAAYATGIAINGIGLNSPLIYTGALVSADGNPNTFAGPITLTANATLGAFTGSLTLTGPIALGSNTLTLSNTNNLVLNGGLNGSGAAALVKNGSGTATLGHDNSAFGTGGAGGSTTGLVAGGGIQINNGILAVTANQALAPSPTRSPSRERASMCLPTMALPLDHWLTPRPPRPRSYRPI